MGKNDNKRDGHLTDLQLSEDQKKDSRQPGGKTSEEMAKNSKESKDPKDSEKNSKKKDMIEFIIYLAVVFALVYLIITYVGQRTVVNGDSMDPTLANGQSLIMDKISYRFSNPGRFDIVIFPGPAEEGDMLAQGDTEAGNQNRPFYIKRVIGLPGETVDLRDQKVYINGKELTSDIYSIDGLTEDPEEEEFPMTLKDDEYFCLGDNRPVSYDSRYMEVGPVSRKEIVGKVWIRIWPLNQFGPVD